MSLLPIQPGKVVAQITVTEEDVFHALAYRERPKNWRHFTEHLSEYLADALNQHVCDEIRYLYNAYLQQQEECPHRRTTVLATGGYYSAGEAWDDLREVTVCLDCGKTLPEPDSSEDPEEVPF